MYADETVMCGADKTVREHSIIRVTRKPLSRFSKRKYALEPNDGQAVAKCQKYAIVFL
jgi:hypothetical protein